MDRPFILDILIIGWVLFILSLTACSSSDSTKAKILSNEEFYLSDSAIAALTEALESRPGDAQLWYERAKAFHRLNAYDEAIGDMSAAMNIDTANVSYHLFLSDVYLEYFKSRLALNTLLRASVLFPQNTEVLLKLSEFAGSKHLGGAEERSTDELERK